MTLFEGVDYLTQMAHVWTDLAHVLTLAGRAREAADALGEALRLYEAKGNVVSAARIREALVDLG